MAPLSSWAAFGQAARNSALFRTLKEPDSIFFERGFNRCDPEYLKGAVGEELVFFHDQGGMQSREIFPENTQRYICGKNTQKPIRKVVPESLEVFPLYNNGVL